MYENMWLLKDFTAITPYRTIILYKAVLPVND